MAKFSFVATRLEAKGDLNGAEVFRFAVQEDDGLTILRAVGDVGAFEAGMRASAALFDVDADAKITIPGDRTCYTKLSVDRAAKKVCGRSIDMVQRPEDKLPGGYSFANEFDALERVRDLAATHDVSILIEAA